MRLCLVEDSAASRLEPLVLTRPVFDLLLGSKSLGSKIARGFGVDWPAGHGAIVRQYLAARVRESHPGLFVNDAAWLARGPVVVANARWLPPPGFRPPAVESTWLGLCDGVPACALVESDAAAGLRSPLIDGWFEELLAKATVVDLGGEWIDRPWDLVIKNADQIARDFAVEGRPGISDHQLATAAIVGPSARLSVHETARVDPYTVFDTTNGPITIGPGAVIQPFTRVEGPCFIGRDTQLFRANLRGGVTIGPNCRIGGEVEASIVHGHSNKYHEGFLGHAYVGEWVNLGAITSNSDLRNDYGEVSVPLQGDPIATGQAKVGCFIGDHSRTGMGSMLNTGTSVGVMCNVLPAGVLLPKHVPSFTAVLFGRVAPNESVDRLYTTARTVKSRRGETFTEAEEQLYLDLYEQTRLERERAFQRADDRREPGRRLAVSVPG